VVADGAGAAKRWVGNLVLLGVTLVIFTGVSEFAARWVLADITTTGDNSSYLALRWRQGVEHNALGFRERELPDRRLDMSIRIVALGDSLTYGQGVDESERFSERIEAALDGAGAGDFEVLNLGKPGASTQDELETLRSVVLDLAPDFVLLQWFPNDVEADVASRPRYWRLIPSDRLTGFLHRNSVLYYLANSTWTVLQDAFGLVERYDDYLDRTLADPSGAAWQDAASAFQQIAETCDDKGIGLGVVLFPMLQPDWGPVFLLERVLAQCRDLGLECLDLTPVYAGAGGDTRALWVNRFDQHPGPEAHRLAAEAILERFGPRWGTAIRHGSRRSPQPDGLPWVGGDPARAP
jgi:hypothetical protein